MLLDAKSTALSGLTVLKAELSLKKIKIQKMSEEKRIYLVTGNDKYAVKNKSRAIIASLCGENFEENPALEIIHGDPDEKEDAEKLVWKVIEAISTPPFLSSEKVVWAKNFPFDVFAGETSSYGKKKKKDSEKSESDVFSRFIEIIKSGLPNEVKILLSVFDVDKRSSFYKACAKNAEIYELEKLSLDTRNLSEVLSKYIKEIASELGLKISPEAENFLIEACGTSHSRILNELEKAASFIYPRTDLSLQDCLDVSSMTPEMASWAFTDAIGRKDLQSAMKALDILITPKNPENSIIYSLINLFSDMAQIRVVVDELGLKSCGYYPEFEQKLKGLPQDLRENFSWASIFIMKPYRIFKLKEQAFRIPPHKFALAFQEILKTNKSLVSGTANPRLELESLAIKLCS